MNLYILIHEQDTDAGCGCTASPFTDKGAAQDIMRKAWEATVQECDYNAKEHDEEDECECCEESAIIRDGINVEAWRIETHDLDVQVAVCVEGGLVSEIIANADLSADVYDLDVSEFPDDGEEDEADKKAAEFKKLRKTPGWREVF